jgi:hypothetical protein
MDDNLAKVAHDTYFENLKGGNEPANLPRPDFEKQPDHIKKAWGKVAERLSGQKSDTAVAEDNSTPTADFSAPTSLKK